MVLGGIRPLLRAGGAGKCRRADTASRHLDEPARDAVPWRILLVLISHGRVLPE